LIRLPNIEDCVDCSNNSKFGEVRIISEYVDDELLLSAILSSIPSFYIIGYVIGSINQKRHKN